MVRMTSVLGALILTGLAASAAEPAPRPAQCRDGVLRWADDGAEVALFGVNYYAPFSIDYQALTARGIDPADALRADLVHLRRLGLDALRLHCWDRELSDPDGNLVDNDHLRLLDLLIAEASRQGLYMVLTPIAWWGTQDPRANGFSNRFTMPQMTTSQEALECQTRYLTQFAAHTNRYTGLRYADDPRIVAFEAINEPIYPEGTPDQAVTQYIDALAAALRRTGTAKPILFNCWGGREQAAAASSIDGVTFGWYPTGLVAGRALTHNCLPLVDRHHNAHTPCLDRLLKVVYEFDAADVQGSCMYPAMAREFRSAGVQVATQFQYDAMALAGTNENWQTHHLNLLYTPGKAISFAIAAEAFRRIPRRTPFPRYPANTRFAGVRVSFEEDLSELVTETDFLYSNTTATVPPAPAALRRIWGVGSSPVVHWPGTGACFLDRLAEGVWRLQIYPDAVVIADPYAGGPREKVRLVPAAHTMRLALPDLGSGFQCRLEGGTSGPVEARDGELTLAPGSYLLVRSGLDAGDVPPGVPFVVPSLPQAPAEPGIRLEVPDLWRQGRPLPVTVTVAETEVRSCTALFSGPEGSRFEPVPLSPAGAYRFRGEVPAERLAAGTCRCMAEVVLPGRVIRCPESAAAFDGPLAPPHNLWACDRGTALPQVQGSGWLRGEPAVRAVPGPRPGTAALRLEAGGFAEPPACAGVRLPAVPPPAGTPYTALAVTLRAGPSTSHAEVSLVQTDGQAYGANIPAAADWRTVLLPLDALRPMWDTRGARAVPARAGQIAVIFGAWLFPEEREADHWLEIAEVSLVQEHPGVPVRVLASGAPVLLARPTARTIRTHGQPASVKSAPGPADGMEAVRVTVRDGFGTPPSATSFRVEVGTGELDALGRLGPEEAVTLNLRAGLPDSDRVEVVLLEEDGTPWGAVVPLRPEWTEARLTAAELRFFDHWPHPEGRGGPGDRLRLDRVRAVNFCFGAWLYGERASRPHAIEVSEVTAAGP